MALKNTKQQSKQAPDRLGAAGHELAMSLRRAYLIMHRATNACFVEYGMTADSFTVLTTLTESGSITQKELVEKISSDANTVSAMLVRLERLELVVRKRDAQDGRARIVELTAKGRHLQEQLWNQSQTLRFELAQRLEPEERKQLVSSLKRISNALELPHE